MNGRDKGKDGDAQDVRLMFRITPEPSEEELAAIAAAVVALSQARVTVDGDEAARKDRWRTAARRETLRSPLRRSIP